MPPGLLAGWPFFQRLNRQLRQIQPDTTLSRFLSLVAGIGLAAFLLLLLITESIVIALLAGLVAAALPLMWLRLKHARRNRQVSDQLPDVLDFLSRVLRAGHSLATGLQMIGEEMPDPVGTEFRTAYGQHSLGQSIDDVLKEMAARIDSTRLCLLRHRGPHPAHRPAATSPRSWTTSAAWSGPASAWSNA